MRHILFLITSLDYGGAERQLVLVTTRLARRGWKVKVVSILPPKAFVEELEKEGIEVDALNITHKWQFFHAWFKLQKIIVHWKPDLVHSFMVHANILARLVRLTFSKYQLVCSVRSFSEGGRIRELLYRLTDFLCDLTTHVSKAGVRKYVRIGAVPADKIISVPNGIDILAFNSKDRLERNKEYFLWLAVGRLVEAKDYPNLLKAFAYVVKRFSYARLWIAGGGKLRNELEGLTSRLRLDGFVEFLGLRKDVPKLMSSADAFVLSSAWEGMPNVLLEASASSLPIVSTRVSGADEIIIDGKTGFLVPPKDPLALSKAMIKLMEFSEEDRKKIGTAAFDKANKYFNIEHIVEKWEKIYIKLIKGYENQQ